MRNDLGTGISIERLDLGGVGEVYRGLKSLRQLEEPEVSHGVVQESLHIVGR